MIFGRTRDFHSSMCNADVYQRQEYDVGCAVVDQVCLEAAVAFYISFVVARWSIGYTLSLSGMYSNTVLIGAVLLHGLVAANGDSYSSSEMGPAAFMWPQDRPWTADADNTAPCGSSSGVGARTEFPLSMLKAFEC